MVSAFDMTFLFGPKLLVKVYLVERDEVDFDEILGSQGKSCPTASDGAIY